jgi:peroxiredoxin
MLISVVTPLVDVEAYGMAPDAGRAAGADGVFYHAARARRNRRDSAGRHTSNWRAHLLGLVLARLRATAVGLLCAVAFAGCSPSQAPEITLVSLSGQEIPLQSLRGRVVVVNFWATSCAVCIREMPDLAHLQRRFGEQGVTVIAVAMRYNPPNQVLDYAKSAALPFVVSLDPMGKIEAAFGGVRGTPTTFIIDKRGQIVQRTVGAPDFPRLHTLLEAKLKEPA